MMRTQSRIVVIPFTKVARVASSRAHSGPFNDDISSASPQATPVSRSLMGLNLPKDDKAVASNASVRALPVIKIA